MKFALTLLVKWKNKKQMNNVAKLNKDMIKNPNLFETYRTYLALTFNMYNKY